MAKFKVGDKVRVKKNLVNGKPYNNGCVYWDEMAVDDVATIITTDQTKRYKEDRYNIDKSKWCYSDDMLELVSFTKADLKDGMVVEYRNGKRRLVFNYTFTGIDGYLEFSNYTNNLTYNYISHEDPRSFDIVKIYEIKYIGKIPDMFSDYNLNLLWERPEEYKEMTVEEIEKALGCKIKVVGEK